MLPAGVMQNCNIKCFSFDTMTTFIAFISPILGFSYFRRYANALLAASQFFSISHAVSDGDEIFLLDIGKTMDFSIQYVMMRPSYVMMRTSLGEILLSEFLCVLQSDSAR